MAQDPDAPLPGDEYLHYKTGRRYRVVLVSLREHDHVPVVSYERVRKPHHWLFPHNRPLSEWVEMVSHEGRKVRRFTKVGSTGAG